ncbi:phenylacetate-CoA oxygenase/reductase subunit PaaK [Actinobacteria bacterium YIM 96077]|uniref:Phenylacetate-CoA oxygenase/reductase subunit PaaK n=1 Tax=Phytoactinopolyspora halophila TaxID=1981511 RepID=A0A329QSJ5_9ACTN|nr:1,2-phenylacetyl-CoA epoxidase subunit PaaE [Phytoactinopolyspora halophila]AYY14912.1 phenylacetate-CoA oxygenase/reductase subunit PaaK [Actinobacteria bacterium YIM 96077]RAW15370.1 phenylacetate-CoA oxygenase/reductase subunit PaaK [Phytoactinopolyspora halophila]
MTTTAKPRHRGDFHSLRVARVDRLCDDAVAITFDVPAELADAYTFRAGQSLTVRRFVDGRDERRSYSICAPEGAPPRIGVREVPDGLFSTWLVHEVRPGDVIEVGTPTGSFTPDPQAPAHHVLIAAGSGITPVLSIAETVLAHPESSITLFYGNRRTETVMFADEVAELKDRHPDRVELVHVLSRETRDVELFSGRLDAQKLSELLDALLDVENVGHWWLCGPFGMVADVQTLLKKLGVPADRIHRELFYVDDVPPPPVRHEEAPIEGPTSEVTIILDGRSTTTTVPQEMSILDGAQEARPDLPFACKGGVCGTCRAKVIEGKVHMRRNFALEESEVEEGFVVTCQGLPQSDKVVVDYDT